MQSAETFYFWQDTECKKKKNQNREFSYYIYLKETVISVIFLRHSACPSFH